jgi:hypothetical protein
MLNLLTLASLGGLFAGAMGVAVIIILILSIFWIWMLIDCLVSTLPPGEKILWFLVIFFLHIIGALLYFFIGRPNASGRPSTFA